MFLVRYQKSDKVDFFERIIYVQFTSCVKGDGCKHLQKQFWVWAKAVNVAVCNELNIIISVPI